MNIKLLAIDMDGTTLTDKKTLAPETLSAVSAAVDAGIMVVAATGRTYGGIPKALIEAGMPYAITGNGASIVDTKTGACIYENKIENACAVGLIKELNQLRGLTYVQYEGEYYQEELHMEEGKKIHPFSGLPDNGIADLSGFIREKQGKVQKVGILTFGEMAEQQAMELQKAYPELKVRKTDRLSVEYNAKTASKGEAMGFLCGKLGVHLNHVMAMGDSDNDIEMLQTAGYGIAMRNASKAAKQAAGGETKSNDQQGVAWIIRNLILHHYQIVFSDIDGTLLTDRHQVGEYTKRCIQGLVSEGIPFVLVSARMPKSVYAIQKEIGIRGPIAAFSGGLILDMEGRTAYSVGIERKLAIEVHDRICERWGDIACDTYSFDRWITDDIAHCRVVLEAEITGMVPEQGTIEELIPEGEMVHKFLCMGEPEQILDLELHMKKWYPDLAVGRSTPNYLEIMNGQATKGHVVEMLSEIMGISTEDTIAFGDNFNDMDMLGTAGVGVAMGNAPEDVKQSADMVTKSNNEEGIAWVLG